MDEDNLVAATLTAALATFSKYNDDKGVVAVYYGVLKELKAQRPPAPSGPASVQSIY